MSNEAEACPLPNRADDDRIRRILKTARTVAVVGMSSKPNRPSLEVGMYLRDHGYEIVPVHPREQAIEGIQVYCDLESIPRDRRIDLVDLFVSGEKTLPVVEQAARIGAKWVWFQPGAEYEPAERRAKELGLEVVSGRCTMGDHARLMGKGVRG